MSREDKKEIWREVYFYYMALVGPAFGIGAYALVHEHFEMPLLLGVTAGVATWSLIVWFAHSGHAKDVRESLQRKPV